MSLSRRRLGMRLRSLSGRRIRANAGAVAFNANGQTAFHFESQNDPVEMKARAEMVLVGNINNPETILAGTPDSVRREVYRALDAGIDIIAPECAVPLDAPMANVKAVADAVAEYAGR